MTRKLLQFIPVLYLLLFLLICRANSTTPIVSEQKNTENRTSETGKKEQELNMPKYHAYEFSEKELQIIEVLKKNRAEKKVKAFDVNLRISEAINKGLENIFREGTQKEIEKNLDTLRSFLGGACFIMRGKSMSMLLGQLNQNERLQKEVGDSTNLMIAIGLTYTTKIDEIYYILYLCKYSIEYGISMVSGLPPPQPGGGTPNTHFLQHEEINGKCNGKYLMYYIYKTTALPFYVEKDDITLRELRTDENRGFSINISYNTNRIEEQHLAIFAKSNPAETYSLIDILILK